MTEGFLSRWSRRKAGKEKENAVDQQLGLEKTASPAADISSVTPKDPNTQTSPTLTLEDVEKIDRFAPDFSAFMKPDVDPVVQQAALKKMFTDPHFNVMDGLDIYIDDYSKPDPLPQGMLERLVQSEMLNLFNKNPEEVAQQTVDTKITGSLPHPENGTLAAESKTDLTSTDIQGTTGSTNDLLKETKNLSGPSSELEQKKT